MGLCKSKSSIIDIDIIDADYDRALPFSVQIEYGKVIKVYDGDTITVASKLYQGSPVYRFQIRLRGIDTPELKSINDIEKSNAIIARDALHEKIFGKVVTLKNIGKEKYGRILADIYLDNININNWLIDSKYAVHYNGGKKSEWKYD